MQGLTPFVTVPVGQATVCKPVTICSVMMIVRMLLMSASKDQADAKHSEPQTQH